MKKIYIFTALGLFAIVAFLAGNKALQFGALMEMAENMQMPPTVVSSSEVLEQEWERSLASIGSLEAVQGVVVSAEVPGRVSRIHFKAGSDVKAGDLLLEQDISTEEAQLRAAEANVALAKNNLDRAVELHRKKVMSQSDYDAADARHKEAVAQADSIRATIAKKSVRAPFAGRLGIRLVNLGQDLSSGDPVVSLQSADPIFVNFFLPQRELHKLKSGLAVRVTTDAAPDRSFSGKLSAMNPQVDAATRNIQIQATLDNADGKLLPGMYVDVEVILDGGDSVLAVPITAIAYATYGDSVFVIEEQGEAVDGQKPLVATQKFVQVGRSLGDYVEITEGLSAGETVVSAGVFKLRSGTPVVINNDTRPEFSLNPQLDDT